MPGKNGWVINDGPVLWVVNYIRRDELRAEREHV